MAFGAMGRPRPAPGPFPCNIDITASRWLAGCMGFLWLTGFSFFHCVASPFHSFVTTSRHPYYSMVTKE